MYVSHDEMAPPSFISRLLYGTTAAELHNSVDLLCGTTDTKLHNLVNLLCGTTAAEQNTRFKACTRSRTHFQR